ncbi:MAG: DUF2027 domain-containing protein [Tannerellaceae bacterium]|jgi:hypothetical protein|nr:DUF2027 domain-containing protein [Tannerellaceae bacterium]
MNIKTGDKVRFLNSVGGGIVRRFQGKDRVWVEGDDGFEIPALLRELVVVADKPTLIQTAAPKERPIEETPQGEELNLYIGYLPLSPKAMTQSGYEAYLINSSNYYLFFNYMHRQNNSWVSRCNGQIEPNTKIFMEEFDKEVLNELERICVQLIAFKKDKPYSLKNALSVEIRMDTVKFYKTHCFTENDFFEENALIVPVIRADVPRKELHVSEAGLKEALKSKSCADAPANVNRKPSREIVEIDLHIEQLLDNVNGLTPGDILRYQLEKFHETLSLYAAKKGQNIVFIHGKGEGVLRSAIEKELKTRYKRYDYQNASFLQYGFGATMVTVR